MACLSLSNGNFVPDSGWSQGNSGSAAGGAVTITRGPTNLFVAKGGSSIPFSVTSRFKVVDDKYVFVLFRQTSATGIDRIVSVVDITGSTLQAETVVNLYSTGNAFADPILHFSQGNKAAFMAVSFRPSGRHLHGFYRSDNGAIIASLGFAVAGAGDLLARIQAGVMEAFYNGSWATAGPVPAGESDVVPNSQTFNDAVIGADIPGLDVQTETFKIENDGNDCLQINFIGSAGPFSFSSSSPALPQNLDPGDSVDVIIQFAPGGVGNFEEDLPISPVPGDGDLVLNCKGEARAASTSISFPALSSFGKIPASTSDTKPARIRNNGEKNITVDIPASVAADLPYSWPAFAGPLSPNAFHDLMVTFSPLVEGAFSESVTFTSSVPSSPHQISFSGTACVANANMDVQVPNPMDPYIDFGDVQRGFRTVRIIKVVNNGDGPLNFSAKVEGTDVALFGIQKDGASIISPPSTETFTILPTDPCGGAAGAGEVFFAVVFFANDAPPKTAVGELVIFNHNASNIAASELRFNLQGNITQPIAVDIELVLDKSGSMLDPSGERRKVDTAIDAGQLFVELMRPDVEDRLGLVSFDTTPTVFSSIDAITTANQSNIGGLINGTNLNPLGGTSIAGGVRVALKDLEDNPRATAPTDLHTTVVVLTDGQDNTPYDDPDGNKYSLLGEEAGTLPLPSPPADVKLYAVGIGDSIDVGRLSTLAQGSGGDYLDIKNFSGTDYFKLEKHFTQIFMEAVDLSIISDPEYTIQPNTQHDIQIEVLAGDQSLMIVIYDREFIRLPFYLVSPKNEVVDLTSVPSGFQVRPGVTNTARFMEVKFPAGEPSRYKGTWTLFIKHEGSACYYRPRGQQDFATHQVPKFEESFGFGFRPDKCEEGYEKPIKYGVAIGVGSDFRMFPFVQPGVVKVGETIQLNAIINEFGLPVLGCNVTVKVETPSGTEYQYSLLDDGLHQDDEAGDGNYGKVFTNTTEEGSYTFTFRSIGYSREKEALIPIIREAVRSKYVEGVTPLVPPGGKNPDTTGDPGRTIEECCRKIGYYLLVIIVLLLLLFLRRWFQ